MIGFILVSCHLAINTGGAAITQRTLDSSLLKNPTNKPVSATENIKKRVIGHAFTLNLQAASQWDWRDRRPEQQQHPAKRCAGRSHASRFTFNLQKRLLQFISRWLKIKYMLRDNLTKIYSMSVIFFQDLTHKSILLTPHLFSASSGNASLPSRSIKRAWTNSYMVLISFFFSKIRRKLLLQTKA